MANVPLKDFIAETLKSISQGVRQAQIFSKEVDGIPIAAGHLDGALVASGDQLVKFNISLQADVSSEKSAAAGLGATLITVVTGSINLGANSKRTENSVHSIEFSVPMSFHAYWTRAEDRVKNADA